MHSLASPVKNLFKRKKNDEICEMMDTSNAGSGVKKFWEFH